MKTNRNCNNFGVQQFPYQPMMPVTPIMPMAYNNQGIQGIDERLNNIEKRLSIIEANIGSQPINSGFANTNYQIL